MTITAYMRTSSEGVTVTVLVAPKAKRSQFIVRGDTSPKKVVFLREVGAAQVAAICGAPPG